MPSQKDFVDIMIFLYASVDGYFSDFDYTYGLSWGWYWYHIPCNVCKFGELLTNCCFALFDMGFECCGILVGWKFV